MRATSSRPQAPTHPPGACLPASSLLKRIFLPGPRPWVSAIKLGLLYLALAVGALLAAPYVAAPSPPPLPLWRLAYVTVVAPVVETGVMLAILNGVRRGGCPLRHPVTDGEFVVFSALFWAGMHALPEALPGPFWGWMVIRGIQTGLMFAGMSAQLLLWSRKLGSLQAAELVCLSHMTTNGALILVYVATQA